MKRPLMWVCLCLVVMLVVRQEFFGDGTDSPPEAFVPADGEKATIMGRVYQKDSNYFYLDSVKLLNSEISSTEISNTAYQQEIPLTYNIICEPGDFEEASSEEVLLGSVVTVQGTVRNFASATNPGEFDAAKYYQTLRIGNKLANVRILSQGRGYSQLKEILYGLKVYWRERLYHIFPQKEASIMSTMLLGEKAGLDRDVKELYQRAGIVHILSISGVKMLSSVSPYPLKKPVNWAFVGLHIAESYIIFKGILGQISPHCPSWGRGG